MAAATVKQIKEFFHDPNASGTDPVTGNVGRPMGLPQMKAEWIGSDEHDSAKKLTDEDKRQLAEGIGNGTLTY
jgi:hypothetical protein